jgi:hypothetical protein
VKLAMLLITGKTTRLAWGLAALASFPLKQPAEKLMAERFLPSKIANAIPASQIGSFNFPDFNPPVFLHVFAANFFASIFPTKTTGRKINGRKIYRRILDPVEGRVAIQRIARHARNCWKSLFGHRQLPLASLT